MIGKSNILASRSIRDAYGSAIGAGRAMDEKSSVSLVEKLTTMSSNVTASCTRTSTANGSAIGTGHARSRSDAISTVENLTSLDSCYRELFEKVGDVWFGDWHRNYRLWYKTKISYRRFHNRRWQYHWLRFARRNWSE
jgi:hypothetical protein